MKVFKIYARIAGKGDSFYIQADNWIKAYIAASRECSKHRVTLFKIVETHMYSTVEV